MERQAELVQAAYSLIAKRGFEGLRTRDIAAQVGVNIATLHYYFPTKEALVRAVVAHAMGRFRSTLSGSGTTEARLRGHFAGLRRLDSFARAPGSDPLRGLLRRARKEGGLANVDPERAATVVIAALKGVVLVPGEPDQAALGKTLAQLERWLGIRSTSRTLAS